MESFPKIGVFFKLSLSLNLPLSMRDRDRADTIIQRSYFHFPPHHSKLFKHLELTYTQVWYIIGIVSSSPTHFHLEKIGLIREAFQKKTRKIYDIVQMGG